MMNDSSINVNRVNFRLVILTSLVVPSLLILEPLLWPVAPLSLQISYANDSLCVEYVPGNNTIRVRCGSFTINEVYKLIEKYRTSIGRMEGLLVKEHDGIWLLKANLVVGPSSSFTINSTDTTWLKIYSDGKEAYSIKVYGKMIIDSVKVTSWDPKENDYYHTSKKDSSDRRAYIAIMREATATNITNSEISYLGYNSSRESRQTPSNGLSYYGGKGSIVKNNDIHDNNFGFYSAHVGGVLIENNSIHHNTYYGMDPHSGTHDMVIRNNKVHDNGKQGIICSQQCRNITIEQNVVYSNFDSAITLSIDMQNSIVRNNYVYNQEEGHNGITISDSSYNQVYENIIASAPVGIKVFNNSSNNYVYNNTFKNIENYVILVTDPNTVNNTFESNNMDTIKSAKVYNNTGSLFISDDNGDISASNEYLIQGNSTLIMERSVFPFGTDIISDYGANNLIISNSGVIILKYATTGNITTFNTDIVPFVSRISNEKIYIESCNYPFVEYRVLHCLDNAGYLR